MQLWWHNGVFHPLSGSVQCWTRCGAVWVREKDNNLLLLQYTQLRRVSHSPQKHLWVDFSQRVDVWQTAVQVFKMLKRCFVWSHTWRTAHVPNLTATLERFKSFWMSSEMPLHNKDIKRNHPSNTNSEGGGGGHPYSTRTVSKPIKTNSICWILTLGFLIMPTALVDSCSLYCMCASQRGCRKHVGQEAGTLGFFMLCSTIWNHSQPITNSSFLAALQFTLSLSLSLSSFHQCWQ